MTPPIVPAIQADREAAASGYYAWLSSNTTVPEMMRAGHVDDHSMVQAFARHRTLSDKADREAMDLINRAAALIKFGPVEQALETAIAALAKIAETESDGLHMYTPQAMQEIARAAINSARDSVG